jgi:hypothetical protein|tara:strand:- start:12180 stop:12503 length:324 start_codon:yes stop_codon:yes gene_type:complete
MLISEKISRIISRTLKEGSEDIFVEFLIQEFGREVTKSELVQAIIGWADLYMQGANSGDFEGVAKYLEEDIYIDVSDDLPAMFKNEIMQYLKFTQNGEEAEGINPEG